MKIRDHAKGRWPEIISAVLGPEWTDPRRHGPCPGNGEGTDRFRFSDNHGTGSFFCACSDGSGDGFDLLQCTQGCDFAGAARIVEGVIGPTPKDDDDSAADEPQETYAMALRRQALTEVPRSKYLESRGLEVAPGLHWHKKVEYRVDGEVVGRFPGMLAPVMRGQEFLTYHVTYLFGDGGRERKILPARGGKAITGASVPLYPVEGDGIGVAEGVETAIAASMLTWTPVWAALNTALMKKWEPPEGVKTVIVFGDHDENYAGQAAAYTLASRLAGKGYEVEVKMPDVPGDWNDELLRAKGVSNG